MLATGDLVAPQAKEVADLLSGEKLGANLVQLETEEEMVVAPHFLIRAREVPSAAQLFFERIRQEFCHKARLP